MHCISNCNIVGRGASKLLELVSNPIEDSIKYVQNNTEVKLLCILNSFLCVSYIKKCF